MPVPPRIIAPVLLAAVCAGLLMAFLWWQLTQSTKILETQKFDDTALIGGGETVVADLPTDLGDLSLIHLRQGDLLALRGEWADAEKEYQASVKAGGGLAALRKLAQAQMQRRDMKGVRATLSKMKSSGARQEDLLLLESILHLRSGELQEARKLLEGAEDSPQKHYGLALLSIVQGNHDIAIPELEKVMNGWEPVLRSYARTIKSAYDEFSLFQDGSNIHLITLIGRALAQVQECELALPLLIQVTTNKNDYRDAWIVQGYCELITERPEEALASLEAAYNLDPQKPEIQYFLARAYNALYEYQNAITFLEYAIQNGFVPESEVRRLIAENALELGDSPLALDQYDAMTESNDATIESYNGYISAAIALGKLEEAYTKAREATERFPEEPTSFELLGDAAIALERTDEAKVALEHALELNPHLTSAKEKLAGLK